MKLVKLVIVFLFLSLLFDSCKNVNDKDNITEESILEARLIFITPDSLLSDKEKDLLEQLKEVVWGGGVSLKDYGYALKYEINVSEEEWKKKGLPEVYFEILKRDIACSNEGLLDTIAFPKQLTLDAFLAEQTKFLSLKVTQQTE